MKDVFRLALLLFLTPLAQAGLSDTDAPALALEAKFPTPRSHALAAPAVAPDPAQLARASALAVSPVLGLLAQARPELAAPGAPSLAAAGVADVRTWNVLREQRSLRNSLNHWANAAGWSLVWDLPIDLVLEASASFTGTFEEAVTAAVSSAGVATYPLQAIFYRGNKVLRIAHANLRK